MGTNVDVLQALARLEGMCHALVRTGKGGADEVAGLMLDEVWAIQDRLAIQDRSEGRESGSAATEATAAGDGAEAATTGREHFWTVTAEDWEVLKRTCGRGDAE